jgi:tetratricopeptide (TPR) repeat protein
MKYFLIVFSFLTLIGHTQVDSDYLNSEPRFNYEGQGFNNFLKEYTKYPFDARNSGVESLFDIKLNIDKCGQVGEITIDGKRKRLFEDEIFRVIRLAPLWQPAIKDGVSVDSVVNLKIGFSLHYPNPDYKNNNVVEILEYRIPLNQEDMQGYEMARKIMQDVKTLIDSAKYDQAITTLNQAKDKKYFSLPDIYYYLGLAHFNQNNKHLGCQCWLEGNRLKDDKSKEEYDKNCEFKSEFDKALSLLENDCYDEALIYFMDASKLAPNDTSVLYYTALNYMKMDKRLNAYEYFILAKENNSFLANTLLTKYFPPNLLAKDYMDKIKDLSEQNDYNGIIECYDKIATLYPNQSFVFVKRAEMKFLTNDLSGACNDLERAIELGDESAKEILNEKCK